MDLEDIYGINLTSSWGPWTARAMAATISIDGTATQTVYSTVALNSVDPLPGVHVPGVAELGQSFGGTGTCLAENGLNPLLVALGGIAECNRWAVEVSADESMDYYALGGQYDDGSLFVVAETAKFLARNANLFSDNTSGYITAGYRIKQWTPYATYAFSYDDETRDHLAASGLTPAAMQSVSFGARRELTDSLSAKIEWNHFYDMENNGVFSGEPGDDTNVYTFALDAVF